MATTKSRCPKCDSAVEYATGTKPACDNCGFGKSGASKSTRFEYKVLTQKDSLFKGKFDPQQIEGALNKYAGEGWRVVATATASIPGLTGTREEIIVILER